MTNMHTEEVIAAGFSQAESLRFHLGSRFYPPIDPSFDAAAAKAIALADIGSWQSTILLPNGKLLTVAQIVEQLRLDPFLDHEDPWAPILSE